MESREGSESPRKSFVDVSAFRRSAKDADVKAADAFASEDNMWFLIFTYQHMLTYMASHSMPPTIHGDSDFSAHRAETEFMVQNE